jgi:hypothetical protein
MLEMIINDVTNWHKEAFPDAEKESQIKKLEEELNEYYEKYDDSELADVFICSIALWRRFKCQIGYAVFLYASSIIPGDKANRIVAEKMRINRLRKWRIVDGVYRHVESGEK